MNKPNAFKLVLAVIMLGGAAFLLVRFLGQGNGIGEEVFFYDLSEKQLFAGPREALPPIRGINDAEEDGVRAIVIALNDDPNDKAGRRIAYLEKYTTEFKQQLEKVRAGQAEPLSSQARNTMRFVRRVDDDTWHPVSSAEGQRILTEWNVPGPDGKFPPICAP